jgi:hypothetical protein
MRLAGTINHKRGQYARVMEADFGLAAYDLDELVGDLPDPTGQPTARRSRVHVDHDDAYKRIAPPEYFERLAGIRVGRRGLVRCPAPWHADKHPSCSVGAEPGQGWCCHSGTCGARGSIYDLASVLQGGPYGPELRGEQFKRARELVIAVFGERR